MRMMMRMRTMTNRKEKPIDIFGDDFDDAA